MTSSRPAVPSLLSYASGVSDVPLLGDTIADNFDRTVAGDPDREALVEVSTGRRWTYAQLRDPGRARPTGDGPWRHRGRRARRHGRAPDGRSPGMTTPLVHGGTCDGVATITWATSTTRVRPR